MKCGWSTEPTSLQSYRGLHRIDPNKCIGCGLCAIECPSEAIQMKVVHGPQKSTGRPKRLPVIHYYLCIFCYHCVDICPRKAYITSNKPPKPVEKKEQLVGDPTKIFTQKSTVDSSDLDQSKQHIRHYRVEAWYPRHRIAIRVRASIDGHV